MKILNFQSFNENNVIDNILDKISQSGVGSLTPSEKKTLDIYSNTGKVEEPKKKPISFASDFSDPLTEYDYDEDSEDSDMVDLKAKPGSGEIEMWIERSLSNEMLIDFATEESYNEFLNVSGFKKQKNSMVHIKGYSQKGIKKGTTQILKKEVLEIWIKEGLITEISDSYLIGYEVDMSGKNVPIPDGLSIFKD